MNSQFGMSTSEPASESDNRDSDSDSGYHDDSGCVQPPRRAPGQAPGRARGRATAWLTVGPVTVQPRLVHSAVPAAITTTVTSSFLRCRRPHWQPGRGLTVG